MAIKLQDFIIAGFLAMAVLFGAGLLVADVNNEYDLDNPIGNDSNVNTSKLDELIELTQEQEQNVQEQESGILDDVAKLFRKPIAVVRSLGTAISVSGGIIGAGFSSFGIDPVFGLIVSGILVTIFIFLFVALLTGRFV